MGSKLLALVVIFVDFCYSQPLLHPNYGLNPFLHNGTLQPQKPVQFHTTTQKPINLANNPFFAQNIAQPTNNNQLSQNNIHHFILQSQNVTSGPLQVVTPTSTKNPINPFPIGNQVNQVNLATFPAQSGDLQGKLPNSVEIPVQSVSPALRGKCRAARGQFPSDFCNKFVNCWDYVAVEESCPKGLLFNAQKGFCDYPESVDCGGRSLIASPGATITGDKNHQQPQTTTHVTISDPSVRKNCLKSRGQFPSTSCNKYFNCWDGVVLEEECPPGTLFSEKGWCDYEYNVDCGQRSFSGIHQGILSSNLIDFVPQNVKQEPIQQIPIQENLTSKPCQNGNPQQETVTTTIKPSSSTANIQTPPAIIIASELKVSKCLKPRGQFPASSCNKYINCWDGLATEEECPKGTLFSEKGYCDYDYNVNCGQRTVTGIHQGSLTNFISDSTPQISLVPSNAAVSLIPTQSPQMPSLSLVPSTVAPNQPIPSVSSQPSLPTLNQISMNPFLGSLFPTKDISNEIPKEVPSTATHIPVTQSSTAQTTLTNLVNSQNQTANNTTTTRPVVIITDPAIKAKCVKPRGQYPSAACNKYINCWDGVVTEEECPMGMLFSENGFCDYSYKVVCGNRTGGFVPATTSDCPAPYGTFRDKSNCSRYYTCINNQIAAKYECPNALQYNDVIGVCDYSYRVDCSKDPLIFPPLRRNVEIKFPSDFVHPPADCIPGTAYRLNPHCTSAAICRKEYTEVVECPAGFAYDSIIDKCTLVHLARC